MADGFRADEAAGPCDDCYRNWDPSFCGCEYEATRGEMVSADLGDFGSTVHPPKLAPSQGNGHAACAKLQEVIDLHSHPLPGIDDGPASIEGSLAMLRRAAADGIRTMVATPHVSAGYPNTRADSVEAGVRTLQDAADAVGIEVTLVGGAELELLHCEMLQPAELPGLRLGDGPYMLVELPFSATAQFAEMLIGLNHDARPMVLAHPERCRAFHEDPELLDRLVDEGALAQVTAASIAGSYGSTVQRSAWSMLEQGLVHVVASDAHDETRRPPLLREPLEEAGLGRLVAMLCEDNPAAILAGERPAPAPPVATPSSIRGGRLRDRLRRR
jgi:protein-tyrosine phosphatase